MLLVLESLSKRYGRIQAVRSVSLEICDGEFVTLLGPTACGKTTLLRIIAGFVKPDEGRVLLDSEDLTLAPVNRRPVGIVFQNYALFPHLTVEGNITFGLRMRGLRMRGVPAAEIAKVLDRMLDLVNLTECRERYPSQLSGGQQQRVALARTLAIEPRILLLDEPLAALDRKLRIQMQEDLKKLVTRIGITTVFVTHDQEEALNLSDRIALLDRGTVVQYDTPMGLYDRPVNAFAASFVGNSNLFPGTVRRAENGSVLVGSRPPTHSIRYAGRRRRLLFYSPDSP